MHLVLGHRSDLCAFGSWSVVSLLDNTDRSLIVKNKKKKTENNYALR